MVPQGSIQISFIRIGFLDLTRLLRKTCFCENATYILLLGSTRQVRLSDTPWQLPEERFKGSSFCQLQSVRRRILSFNVFKAFQWAPSVGAAADIRLSFSNMYMGESRPLLHLQTRKMFRRASRSSQAGCPIFGKSQHSSTKFESYYRLPVQVIANTHKDRYFQGGDLALGGLNSFFVSIKIFEFISSFFLKTFQA